MTRTIRGIARWSRLAVVLAALLLPGCSGVVVGIRVLVVNGTNTQYIVRLQAPAEQFQFNLNTGNQSVILEGDVGQLVTAFFEENGQVVATVTCTATGRIVGPDDPGVEYGEIFIQDFNGPPVAECTSGWEEEII